MAVFQISEFRFQIDWSIQSEIPNSEINLNSEI
jgi:hypothetical protein